MKKTDAMLLLLFAFATVQAQEGRGEKEEPVSFLLGAGFVSSYVWRGACQSGFSVQPAMGVEAYGFALSAWGSTDIAGKGFKEVDFTLGYAVADFSVAITDYWWMGEGHGHYFKYKNRETDHLFEGAVSYALPSDRFPLRFSWNTVFAGADYKAGGNRAYSTYVELLFPFAIQAVDLEVSLASTPWESLYATGFAVVNAGIGASKTVKINDRFSLPVFGRITANPESEDLFFVFGFNVGF
jgi:hypothetical protein